MHFKIASPKKMKNRIQTHHHKIIFFGLLAFAITLIESCSTKAAFMTSTVVPAAEGSVKVKKDKNHNYKIQLQIKNLAEPERLQPSKRTYVVWMITKKDNIKNIGQLNSSSGFLSSKLKASFSTVSAFKPTKIFITAEDDGAIQYPGSQVVLSTDNF